MAVTMLYFTEFGIPVFRHVMCVDLWRNLCASLLYFVVRVWCHRKEISRSLSHLLMSFLFIGCACWSGPCWHIVLDCWPCDCLSSKDSGQDVHTCLTGRRSAVPCAGDSWNCSSLTHSQTSGVAGRLLSIFVWLSGATNSIVLHHVSYVTGYSKKTRLICWLLS